MRMNRRNVLVGLGTIVAGGGAALGTGAFSSVEADRTVSIDTAGDADAYLGISVSGNYATDGGSGDAIQLDLGDSSDGSTGFNDNAVTSVDGILTLSNNAADGNSITVGFDDGSGNQTATTTVVVETDSNGDATAEVEFSLASDDGSGNQYTLSDTSSSVDVNATVRTGDRATGSATADKTEGTLTLIAN